MAGFDAWRAELDLDSELGRDVFRLLPLVYERMRRLGVQGPLMGRLKGVYRQSWCRTNTTLHRAIPVIASLEAAGIRTLMLKGVPLIYGYYANPAVRPMSDADVMVPLSQVRQAMAVLESAGWLSEMPATEDHIAYRHALSYRNVHGDEIDLHWHVMPELATARADFDAWSGAREFEFGGIHSRQLSPEFMLMHLIVHGVHYNQEPPVRWISDAVTVLRVHGTSFDWPVLIALARRHRLTSRLYLGIDHLAQHYAAPIPGDVLRELACTPTSLVERIENSLVMVNYDVVYRHALAKVWVIVAEYCRRNQANSAVGFLTGLTHYFRYRWRLRQRRLTAAT
jgi:hypothetical protein